jgi:hypothetical protein
MLTGVQADRRGGLRGEEAARGQGPSLGALYLAKFRVMAQLKEPLRRLQDE